MDSFLFHCILLLWYDFSFVLAVYLRFHTHISFFSHFVIKTLCLLWPFAFMEAAAKNCFFTKNSHYHFLHGFIFFCITKYEPYSFYDIFLLLWHIFTVIHTSFHTTYCICAFFSTFYKSSQLPIWVPICQMDFCC